MQVPPTFSAVKRNGKKLYVLARQGVEVAPEPREVNIHALELLSLSRSTIRLGIKCSKGTYIRSLCADIGEKLGCGAHVYRLQRTCIGDWHVDKAVPYSRIFALSRHEVSDMLEPIENMLPSFIRGEVSPLAEHYALNGLPIDIDQIRYSGELNVGDPLILRTWRGKLIGIFRAKEPSPEDLRRRPSLPFVLSPEKILSTTHPPRSYPSQKSAQKHSRRPRGSFKRRGPSGRGPSRRPSKNGSHKTRPSGFRPPT